MISEENIKKNLETFSFPRLSGTVHEKKAFDILKEEISALGITPTIQKFTFSTFYSRIYPKIIFTLGFWLLCALFLNTEGYFTIVNVIIILIMLPILFFLMKKPESIKFGKILPSQNIHVKISSEKSADKNILLFAHLDSKAQRLPIRLRVNTIRAWLYSLLIGMILIMLNNLFISEYLSWFFIIGAPFLIVNLIATVLIDINTTNNKSPGTLDNASGVTCVLELLTHFSNPEQKLKHYNLWFVFTGAEECGTMGIRHFCNIINNLDREKTFVINFDGIGTEFKFFSNYIYPKKNNELFKVFRKKAEEIGLELDHVNASIGVHSDGLYLRKQKFREFGFADVTSYLHVHSINDTVDKADCSLLEKICKLNSQIYKELDDLN